MGTYDRQRETARAKIAKYGRQVDLVTYSQAVGFGEQTPWRTDSASETVQTPFALFLTYDAKLVDGTVIHQGDQKVLMAAKGLSSPPVLNGALRVGDVTWKIVNVGTLSPNGEDILHTLQVRQ